MAKKKKSTKRIGRRSRGMSKGTKTLLVVGAAAGAGYLLYKAMQKEEVPLPEGPGGELSLQLVFPPGSTVGRASGIGAFNAGVPTVLEGTQGIEAIVTVVNTSVYGTTAVKAPYNFGLQLQIVVLSPFTVLQVLPPAVGTLDHLQLAAGGTGTYTWGGTSNPLEAVNLPPVGTRPTGACQARALLYPTDGGAALSQAVFDFSITPTAVTPSGRITW